MKNPFGDDIPLPGPPPNPFGDDPDSDPPSTIEHIAARIRRLKSQVGAEGLTPTAHRELLDQIALALDTVARGLRSREEDP